MNRRRVVTASVLSALAVLLVVIGAAARPLIVPDDTAPAEVLTAIEIAFVQDMSAHHQQAVLLITNFTPGPPDRLATLTQQIDRTQRGELGMMLGWLQLAEVTPTNPAPMAWMAHSHSHHGGPGTDTDSMTMPGWLSRAELDALSAARGTEAERQFLALMRRHHRGALLMAQAADAQIATGPVKLLARAMIATQSQEVGLMTILLDQLNTATR
ncbi:DUF305 domain-containing protein [Nocardia gipuzkoensis]